MFNMRLCQFYCECNSILICVNEIFIFEFFIAMYVYDDYNDTNLTNSL